MCRTSKRRSRDCRLLRPTAVTAEDSLPLPDRTYESGELREWLRGAMGLLTPRAAEALLWLAQGKTNSDIATILGITESTVKKYVQEMFDKLGVETRGAATIRALEILNSSPGLKAATPSDTPGY